MPLWRSPGSGRSTESSVAAASPPCRPPESSRQGLSGQTREQPVRPVLARVQPRSLWFLESVIAYTPSSIYPALNSVCAMAILRPLIFSLILYASLTEPSNSQWSPFGRVLDVTITNDCVKTLGEIALAKPDGIFYCPVRAQVIDAQVEDASHFYLVQAYGQLAIHNSSRKLADCWAAHQLARAPNGRHYIEQWIRHWKTYGVWNATYGRPEQRIANVRSCCACGI